MKVLLATDGSKAAEDAALLLAQLPHEGTMDLTILSINYYPLVFEPIEIANQATRNEAEEIQLARNACDRIERMFEGADVRCTKVIRNGHPGVTIVDEAQQRGIDLIVVGSIGHSTFSRMLLGSSSDFVASHAPCSVLVARPTPSREAGHHYLKACIAYDGSDATKHAIGMLRANALPANTHYDLVSILSLPYPFSDLPIQVDTEEIRTALTREVEAAALEMRDFASNVCSHVIESEHVGDGVVEFAAKNQSDIILMGDTGRGLLGRFLLGSVSRYVLRHANCSVWIARKRKDPI